MNAETESQARASLGKPRVSHLRYASQVLQIQPRYLNPGNYRVFSFIQSSTITLAHSDEPHIQIFGEFVEIPIPQATVEHEWKMRLLQTHSRTSERQGSAAGKVSRKRERREGPAIWGRNKSATKAIAIPPATWVGRESDYGKVKCYYKNETVLCPSRYCQCYPDHPQLPSGGGGRLDEEKNNTEYAKSHLKPSPQLRKRFLCHK